MPLTWAEYAELIPMPENPNNTAYYRQFEYTIISQGQVNDPARTNIYLDINSHSGDDIVNTKHCQGTLVDQYENLLALEEDYKKAQIQSNDYNTFMANFENNEKVAEWISIKEKLDQANEQLEIYQYYLENKDLIQSTAAQEVLSDEQYTDLDSFLRMKILKLQTEIATYQYQLQTSKAVIPNVGEFTYNEYSSFLIEQIKLNNQANESYRILRNTGDNYNKALENFASLILFDISSSNNYYNNNLILDEMLTDYWEIVNSHKENSDAEISKITEYTALIEANETYYRYQDHLNQLKFNSTVLDKDEEGNRKREPSTAVEKIICKIQDFIESYNDSIQLEETYGQLILNNRNKRAKKEEQRKKIEDIKNTDIPENFDHDWWMKEIETQLARYLITLAESYQNNVEARYNV